MKIAFIVRTFPKISETFILNQITGIIDLGNDVEIFSFYNPGQKKIHPDIKTYDLMNKVHYMEVPKNKIKRIFKVVNIIIKNFHNKPITILKSLNVFKYKKDAFKPIEGPSVNSKFGKT